MTTTPATYRESDGEAVLMADAKAAWADEARKVLQRVAGEYHSLVDYAQLAAEVQATSGIKTRSLTRGWIGDVLTAVGRGCYERGEPLLSSLCVRADGTIGEGYAATLAATYGGEAPADLEMQSAEERLKCYVFFGAAIPASGGRPALERRVAARRSVIARKNKDEIVRPTCPTCYLALPATGQCDNCAE